MIKTILANTQLYLEKYPKYDRKVKGQFFTSIETAKYMANNIKLKDGISVLDMGAGTGILSAAILEKVLHNKSIKTVKFTLCENDVDIVPTLESNVEVMKKRCKENGITLTVEMQQDNFITSHADDWKNRTGDIFDVVISNPPYKKISKADKEAVVMADVVYGQPNIYSLFMAMGLNLLKENGELVAIVPRSWTSGLYFREFRKYFLKNLDLMGMHLFVSRDKVFSEESVLQETMIVFGKKSNDQSRKILITTSEENENIHTSNQMIVDKDTVITNNSNLFLLLPTNNREHNVIRFMEQFTETLATLGYMFKTGAVVEFRNEEIIAQHYFEGAVPLIRPLHMNTGRVFFPVNTKKNQYIKYKENDSMFLNNTNTILLKRFTTKEEHRRLQPAIVLSEVFEHKHYAIENHVNYLVKLNGIIDTDELYGLMAIFSSKLWDDYYRILNGNTQVNAGEINNMPMPSLECIVEIGRKVKKSGIANCDTIIEEVICG